MVDYVLNLFDVYPFDYYFQCYEPEIIYEILDNLNIIILLFSILFLLMNLFQ